MFRLMFGGMLSDRSRYPELKAATDRTAAVLDGLMEDQLSGEDASGPVPSSSVALATWSTVHGLAFLFVEGLLREEEADLGVEEVTRRVTRVLGRGLRSYGGSVDD